jgi:mannobiose 2-epimerase
MRMGRIRADSLAVTALALAALVGRAQAQPAAAARPAAADLALAGELDAYLLKHVLQPRFPACVDRERGGFHANFATDWTRQPDRRRFVVYQARNTWNAAAVALARPALSEEYLAYARHGIAFLRDRMWDRERGGFYTTVRLDGAPDPAETSKMTYGQAFAVYALAVAHRATGDAAALEAARRGHEWTERNCREQGRPGYVSGVQSDGSPLPVDRDAIAPGGEVPGMGVPALYRDMNTHIHLLEAWTELLREWPDPALRASTLRLFELLRDSFYSEPGTLHLFLDPRGYPVAGPSSFGHDVETAFLLLEAHEALGLPADAKLQRVSRRLVDHALALGWNADTGQLDNEGFALRPAFDRSLQWWAQFELVNALSLMHALHGQETPRYRQALDLSWRFTRERLTDHEKAGVFGGVREDGTTVTTKSSDWMAGYHTTRALLLTSERLRNGR